LGWGGAQHEIWKVDGLSYYDRYCSYDEHIGL
jgi:hypothetical protein